MNIVIRPIQAPQITKRGGGDTPIGAMSKAVTSQDAIKGTFCNYGLYGSDYPLKIITSLHIILYIYLNGVKGHWLSSIQERPIPHFVVNRAMYGSHATTYIACVFSHPFPPHSPLITHTFTHLLNLHTLAHSLTVNWLYYTKFHTLYSMFRDNDNKIIVLQKK